MMREVKPGAGIQQNAEPIATKKENGKTIMMKTMRRYTLVDASGGSHFGKRLIIATSVYAMPMGVYVIRNANPTQKKENR